MPLSAEQVSIIKSTVPVLVEHGNTITSVFYKNMLDAHPSLFDIFNKTKQVNGHQPRALAGALHAYAANIDNLAALQGALDNITQKHASLFVKAEQYDIVGKYLLEAMSKVLGDALTPAVLDAWTAAYTQLAGLMIAQEAKIYAADAEWADWRAFKISRRVKESEEITSFYLSPVDGATLPTYKAGQYISVRTAVPDVKYLQARQYSLSDAYDGSCYRISVKREDGLDIGAKGSSAHPGFISNILHTMAVGETLQVSHPHGDFFLSAEAEAGAPVVLLSAGVGVTPVMSMLNTLVTRHATQPISWVQAARSSASLPFGEHVRSCVADCKNVKSNLFIKNLAEGDVEGVHYQHVGRMDLGVLHPEHDLFLGDARAEYYICGPESFMGDMKMKLRGLGVDENHIRLESFGAA